MKGKFDRLLTILNLLDREARCTVKELAEELQVNERSVYRYLKSLQDAHFPIFFDRERGTYAFVEGFKLKKAHLSLDETLALGLARNLLSTLGETFERAFQSLEQKILDVSSPSSGRVSSSGFLAYSHTRPAHGDLSNLVGDLARASVEHLLVHISYERPPSKEVIDRELEPYYIFFSSNGVWYLRAYCRLRDDWRIFALDRVGSWQVLDRHFLPRLTGDEIEKESAQRFEAYVDGEPVDVVLRFTPQIAPYVKRKTWHPSQKIKSLANGWLEMRMVIPDIKALRQWIYSWIPHVQVVEPKELKELMLKDLKVQNQLLIQEQTT